MSVSVKPSTAIVIASSLSFLLVSCASGGGPGGSRSSRDDSYGQSKRGVSSSRAGDDAPGELNPTASCSSSIVSPGEEGSQEVPGASSNSGSPVDVSLPSVESGPVSSVRQSDACVAARRGVSAGGNMDHMGDVGSSDTAKVLTPGVKEGSRRLENKSDAADQPTSDISSTRISGDDLLDNEKNDNPSSKGISTHAGNSGIASDRRVVSDSPGTSDTITDSTSGLRNGKDDLRDSPLNSDAAFNDTEDVDGNATADPQNPNESFGLSENGTGDDDVKHSSDIVGEESQPPDRRIVTSDPGNIGPGTDSKIDSEEIGSKSSGRYDSNEISSVDDEASSGDERGATQLERTDFISPKFGR